jgi:hypothetical protein
MACAKIAEQERWASRAQQQFEQDRSTCTPARWALWKNAQKRGGLFYARQSAAVSAAKCRRGDTFYIFAFERKFLFKFIRIIT